MAIGDNKASQGKTEMMEISDYWDKLVLQGIWDPWDRQEIRDQLVTTDCRVWREIAEIVVWPVIKDIQVLQEVLDLWDYLDLQGHMDQQGQEVNGVKMGQ